MHVVVPLLRRGDADALAGALSRCWSRREIRALITHDDADVRRVTAVALGCIGNRDDAPCLARALHDADALAAQMAEHGLWSIWFRGSRPEAVEPFREGFHLMGMGAYGQAIGCFEAAFRVDPSFAEAFHQCALAHFFLEQWDEAIADCRRTLRRMPMHFGAMAVMGHVHAVVGRAAQAARCYRRALAIHPRLTEVRAALENVESRLGPCLTSPNTLAY
jgi:tetratricopeptide (TPR) repeat protein